MGCASSKSDDPSSSAAGGKATTDPEVSPSPVPVAPPAQAPAPREDRKTSFLAAGMGDNDNSDGSPIPTTHIGFHSHCGEKGGLTINQDRGMVTFPFAGDEERLLLCVFDGHGKAGHRVSEVVAWQFVQHMEKGAPKEAMKDAPAVADAALKEVMGKCVVDVDDWLAENAPGDSRHSGTTAIIVMLGAANSIICANVGDSRAVLGRANEQGDWTAIDLSSDHKVDEQPERARLEAAGGKIEEAEDGCSAKVWASEIGRGGGVSMSRSLGDHHMGRELLINTPTMTERQTDAKDECLILASDGVWEFITSQRAIEIVQAASGDGATAACKALINAAQKEWAANEEDYRDDITAIVVFFPIFDAIKRHNGKNSRVSTSSETVGAIRGERRRNSVVMQADIEHQLEKLVEQTSAAPTTGGKKKDRLSFTLGTVGTAAFSSLRSQDGEPASPHPEPPKKDAI